jgi:hypothetical protein
MIQENVSGENRIEIYRWKLSIQNKFFQKKPSNRLKFPIFYLFQGGLEIPQSQFA